MIISKTIRSIFHKTRILIFGLKVFFKRITFKNMILIAKFVFKRYILKIKIPFSVVFALTYRCQCNCIHCSVADYERNKHELTTSQIKKIISMIKELGCIKVTFFGGEPFLRDDIIELVSYTSSLGLRVSIDTNGIGVNREIITYLKRHGISNINVSIDSADENIHDSLRGVKGCFKKAIETIKLCVENKIPVLVSTYASKRALNSGDIKRIIELAKKLNANGVKILFPILSGKWRKKEEELLTENELKILNSLIDPSYVYLEDALEMFKTFSKSCSAMNHNLIYISPSGELQPCPAIPYSFGNVLEKDLKKIYFTMLNHDFFKKYSHNKGCIMNDINFRTDLFSNNNSNYPIKL